MPTRVVFWYKMRLLFKNISLTKKVEFTLSSKIIQAACLFLFSGSVSKLSFDRIIIDETCHLSQNSSACNQFFRFHFISHITSKFFFWMQICPPEKNKYFVPTKRSVKKGRRNLLGNFLTWMKLAYQQCNWAEHLL